MQAHQPSPAVAAPAQGRRLDWRGIGWYLLLTLGLTWAIEAGLMASGVRFDGIPALAAQWVVAAVMWVPAASAFIVRRWITREGFRGAGLRWGPWRPYLAILAAVPLTFAAAYLLTWALGLGHPDWTLQAFLTQVGALGGQSTPIAPSLLLPALLVTTIFIAPWINGIFGFGEEFGWTGFLLPKLLPLGPYRAAIIYGVVWGIWHAPLILMGFNYPGHPLAGILLMCGMAVALALNQVALWLRYESVLLTAFFHGAFNSQAYGIWRVLFADTHPLWGGITGLTGVLLASALGLWLLARSPSPPPDSTE